MRSRTPIIAAIALVCAGYVAWPYVTLFRLAEAVRQGDAATLESLVEWDDVREGIKEDVCDTVFDEPTVKVAVADGRLPPFGYSFVRGIASNAIDEEVSAQALVTASRQASVVTLRDHPASPRRSIVWAFFDGPTTFSVLVRPPGAGKHQLVRLRLELERGTWKVTRVWLPPTMLAQANGPS
jgi:hypothetical protein